MAVVRYLPEWLPGIPFHNQARQNRLQISRFVNEPFNAVKKQLVSFPACILQNGIWSPKLSSLQAEGIALPCFVSDILSSEDTMAPESENILKHAATAAYGGT